MNPGGYLCKNPYFHSTISVSAQLISEFFSGQTKNERVSRKTEKRLIINIPSWPITD